MNITRAAIDKRVVTLVALFVVCIGGIQAYNGLPRAEDPGFIIRTAQIVTVFPGASPERVELLVTDKIEKVVQEIPELDFVTSTSKTGQSVVLVNILESEFDMRPIWDSLRRKIDDVAGELPEGIRGPTVNDEFGDVFGSVISVTGEGFSYAELKDVADEVRDELLYIREVAKVEIHGDQEERVFIEYDNARLAELGLSPAQLQQTLSSLNIITPGGDVIVGPQRLALEPSGNFDSVEAIRRAVIQVPGSRELIALQDVANVYRGTVDPPTSKVRSSGDDALILAISMREGGNIITLGNEIQETLSRVQGAYPIGIEFDTIAFQPQVVEEAVDSFVGNLLQAVGIVMAVMLITLGLRTGLVVASLIPTTMIVSFLVMSVFGVGIDQISLAALIIALGLLVDNAIVMAESIMVAMAAGKKAVEAAVGAASELRVPLLTSSLTTAAAFLPIALAESAVGEYCAPLFYVVTIALLSSWVLALTMTPLLCSIFLRVKPSTEAESFDSRLYRSYRVFLMGSLRRPAVFLLVVIAIFAVAMWGAGFLPNIFFPAKDISFFTAEYEFPAGTDIEVTDAAIADVERYMREDLMADPENEVDGITHWASFIGQGAPRFVLAYGPTPPKSYYSIMIINSTSPDIFDELAAGIEGYCRERYPDMTAKVKRIDNGPAVQNPIEVRIAGRETDRVFAIADAVKAKLADIAGSKSITEDWGPRAKKLDVHIDQDRALRAGLTGQDIAVSLQALLSGMQVSEYRENEDVIPITMRSVADVRQDIGRLESLNVYSQSTGSSVPLKQVADVRVIWEAPTIYRRDRLRTLTVQSQLEPGFTAMEVFAQLQPWLEEASQGWGLGYSWEFGGEAESSAEAQASVMAKMPLAGLAILLLLVSQFNSLRKPLIILLTIPLGLIGVVFGLTVAKSYFGFMTLLGVISLSGIVINNAIVLIDRIRIEEEENGRAPADAIMAAAQQRLRPILLTTATTAGGLVPLWLGGGPMFESMAITILFGLLFATGLTLAVVPVLYSLFFRVRFR